MKEVTVTYKLYKFDELSDEAKEKARDWWREATAEDTFWSDNVIEDAAECGKRLGITFDERAYRTVGGQTRYKPKIYWTGFYHQGDGACFEGRWEYDPDIIKNIKDYAPLDETLITIAERLVAIQTSFNKGRLYAKVEHFGRYYHAHSTHIDVYYTDAEEETGLEAPYDVASSVAYELRKFMNWIYRRLEEEYEYQLSDENVDENIRINEYDFFEDGSRACL